MDNYALKRRREHGLQKNSIITIYPPMKNKLKKSDWINS
jgi:hypothetical protein